MHRSPAECLRDYGPIESIQKGHNLVINMAGRSPGEAAPPGPSLVVMVRAGACPIGRTGLGSLAQVKGMH